MPRGIPTKAGVKVNLGLVELSGEWEPNDVERTAAWQLYVELVTRVTVVPFGPDDGSLREALTSLNGIFATTRDVLRRAGPDVAEPKPRGQYSFAFLALTILNSGIRPLLTHWQLSVVTCADAGRPGVVGVVVRCRSWTNGDRKISLSALDAKM